MDFNSAVKILINTSLFFSKIGSHRHLIRASSIFFCDIIKKGEWWFIIDKVAINIDKCYIEKNKNRPKSKKAYEIVSFEISGFIEVFYI